MVSWEPIRNEVVHLLNSGHKQEAISITKNRGADHVARLETEMLALTAYARNKATYFMDYSEVRHLRLEKITTILTGSGVLLSFLIALMAVKRIAKAEKVLLNEKIKLQRALDEIKTLRGIIPICAHCKQIRDDMGSWTRLEEYIHEHSEAQFSHGICPDCMKKYYPQEYATISKKKQMIGPGRQRQ